MLESFLFLSGFFWGVAFLYLLVKYKQKKELKQFGSDLQRRPKKPFNNFDSEDNDGGSDG